MVELAGIMVGVAVGGWLAETARRALLGARMQRTLALAGDPRTSSEETSAADG